jgi:hypothetical protein
MSQPNPLVGRDPLSLAIRPAVIQAARRPLERRCTNRITPRKRGDNSAHKDRLLK